MKPKSKKPSLDAVTSINEDGSRFIIHPADVKGQFTRWRRISALFLIGIYILLPWIPINGYPAIFLDVLNRRFHLFGITLAAQDMWLLFFFVSGLAFLLFFITAFLGRVWCGWACPQTIFLEHVFRRVERWIEGDAPKRKALDNAPFDGVKLFKRGLKHGLFLLLASAIAHIFLSYFISIPQLWQWMTTSPLEHWGAFVFVFVATGLMYVNFAFFREQLCIVICPYGRLQSALIDDDTYNVAYDFERGNPPGPVKDESAGDCIGCRRCIQVCPTGIDIRHGLQLECIGCSACMDACDEIMDKVKRPRGLIRYASDRNLQGFKTRWIRPRTILYTALLFMGIGVAGFAFTSVEQASATATRMPGSPFYVTDTHIRNQYQIRLINKDTGNLSFSAAVQASGLEVPVQTSGFEENLVLTPMEERNATFVVQVPRETFIGPFPLQIVIEAEPGGMEIIREVEFLGPDPALLRKATP
ncbi:cytochrome c oxidase accessory protein CcoG [Puniceicoccales bacterium CK1056]|uniref:Cytochrome c oxidase accessory protein CcoG n=1 Tax=Oceanipulchritudo coccoides TaxID=2706888 RepID=A0A6B2LXB7_9BACT|nr:cytochrome c oxidase accessory protein CcoG [Oceanipulchritudo coccoides]NDV60863.1 cytochrome c oxidase accessory protein CcoG [Oceanipulchritudo coccoides]